MIWLIMAIICLIVLIIIAFSEEHKPPAPPPYVPPKTFESAVFEDFSGGNSSTDTFEVGD